MKYENIASNLGWEECPDNQEGLFLQPEEAASIDKTLGEHASNAAQVTALTTENETLKTAAATDAETISTQTARITELEAQVEKMGSEPSGNGSILPVTEDTNVEKGNTPAHLSDEDPANAYFDKMTRNRKK